MPTRPALRCASLLVCIAATPHCNRLQQTAAECNRLQQTATDCIFWRQEMQCVAVCCSLLHSVATDCLLHSVATDCPTPLALRAASLFVHVAATPCNTLQHTATHIAPPCNTPTLRSALQRTTTHVATHRSTRCNTLQNTSTLLCVFSSCTHIPHAATEWRTRKGCLQVQVSPRKRAARSRALLQNMTSLDKDKEYYAHSTCYYPQHCFPRESSHYTEAKMHRMPSIAGLFPPNSH